MPCLVVLFISKFSDILLFGLTPFVRVDDNLLLWGDLGDLELVSQ